MKGQRILAIDKTEKSDQMLSKRNEKIAETERRHKWQNTDVPYVVIFTMKIKGNLARALPQALSLAIYLMTGPAQYVAQLKTSSSQSNFEIKNAVASS
jgi:hypothetical protein